MSLLVVAGCCLGTLLRQAAALVPLTAAAAGCCLGALTAAGGSGTLTVTGGSGTLTAAAAGRSSTLTTVAGGSGALMAAAGSSGNLTAAASWQKGCCFNSFTGWQWLAAASALRWTLCSSRGTFSFHRRFFFHVTSPSTPSPDSLFKCFVSVATPAICVPPFPHRLPCPGVPSWAPGCIDASLPSLLLLRFSSHPLTLPSLLLHLNSTACQVTRIDVDGKVHSLGASHPRWGRLPIGA